MTAMGTLRRRRGTRAILLNRFDAIDDKIGGLRALAQGSGRGQIFLSNTEKKGEGHPHGRRQADPSRARARR